MEIFDGLSNDGRWALAAIVFVASFIAYMIGYVRGHDRGLRERSAARLRTLMSGHHPRKRDGGAKCLP